MKVEDAMKYRRTLIGGVSVSVFISLAHDRRPDVNASDVTEVRTTSN